jgi:hypothetical protein
MSVPDPLIDIRQPWQDSPALTNRDMELLRNFHERLNKEKQELCDRCEETWFRMDLNDDNTCGRCIKVDKDIDLNEELCLFSSGNLMDPGPILGATILPELSQVEEMLVSRVHCFVEVRQIRGQQYKYRGHVVNFLNNTAKVYNVLPLLPEDLDIIIIRPKGWRTDPRMANQGRKDFKVRKAVIKTWLLYLRQNHPAYHPSVLAISDENLDALDDDAFVDDELIVHEIDDELEDVASAVNAYCQDANNPIDLDDDDPTPEMAAVPDLRAQNDERTEIEAQLARAGARTVGRQPRRKPGMSMPTLQATPLSKYNKSHALLS